MIVDSSSDSRYALSFSTGALLAREAALLAPIFVECLNWEKVRDRAVEDNLLQARTHRTGVRLVRETVKRLSVLTRREVELLNELTAPERGHLMWVAACRRYGLIGEFAEDVVRERFLVLSATLQYEDFDSFVRSKALWHDELTTIKDSTMQKLRSNVFKMLVEAELLSASGHIIPAVLSERLIALLSERAPSDVRFFPTRSAA
ncbi:DUF1819 family protein [Georgenia sp. H159]|uniref:DUF1819 family protein n=1 Tax=Georgenia sp. H159 TaxID=3076115 RepID=UPI002D7A2E19|nr:DUF1819 family protein [Georgenia sp. H159]